MKKRMLAIMMSALMAAGVCSGVTVYADADSKTLTVGFDAEYPPFGYMDENGEYVGFDLDIAQKVCDNLGWELVKKPINWDSKDMELNSGNIDCIWNGFTITPERQKAICFTPPYLKNAQVVVVRQTAGFQKLADLAGRKVGTQAGSAGADAIAAAADFKASLGEVVEFKDYLTALMDLESQGVDAIVMDLLVANDNIRRSGKPFRILDETLSPETFGVGFRLGDDALMNEVWGALKAMQADGTVSKLAEKWFGADISAIGKAE